jgi:hypothetical protein
MKSKVVLIAIAVLSLFSCAVAFALPSDAESNTDQMTKLFPAGLSLPFVRALGFGGSGDIIADKNLDDGSDLSDTYTVGGTVYYDPIERLHLNLFLGSSRTTIGSVGINNNATTKVELKSESGFVVGGGGKVDIVEFPFPVWQNLPNLKLFATSSYRNFRADVDEIHNVVSTARRVVEDLEVEYNQWQTTLGVSQRWDDPLGMLGIKGINFSAVPYIGLQYSDGSFKISGSSSIGPDGGGSESVKTGERNADEVLGVVAGLQLLTFNQVLTVNVEGRFVTETAGTVSGMIRW